MDDLESQLVDYLTKDRGYQLPEKAAQLLNQALKRIINHKKEMRTADKAHKQQRDRVRTRLGSAPKALAPSSCFLLWKGSDLQGVFAQKQQAREAAKLHGPGATIETRKVWGSQL